MPPGIEVIVGSCWIEGIQRTGLLGLIAIDAVIVVLVRAVINDFAMPDDQHAVDVSVLAAGKISVQLGERFWVESNRGGRGHRPGSGWPSLLGRGILCQDERHPERNNALSNAHQPPPSAKS